MLVGVTVAIGTRELSFSTRSSQLSARLGRPLSIKYPPIRFDARDSSSHSKVKWLQLRSIRSLNVGPSEPSSRWPSEPDEAAEVGAAAMFNLTLRLVTRLSQSPCVAVCRSIGLALVCCVRSDDSRVCLPDLIQFDSIPMSPIGSQCIRAPMATIISPIPERQRKLIGMKAAA